MSWRCTPESFVAWTWRATKIGLYECAHLLIRPVWWCLSLVWLWPTARNSGDRRRILLLANNEMLALFAADLSADLAQDDRIELSFSSPAFVDRRVPNSQVVANAGLPQVGFLRALVTRWDLIINPDHFPSALFHPRIPKIFSAHGLFTGKRVRGALYEYGPRARRWNGRPIYKKIFASGAIERDCALRSAPSLAPVVAVTGSLQVDKLLTLNRRRDEIRKELAIPAGRKTLIVMSSWGPNCLLQRDAQRLFPVVRELTDEYHVFLAAHRNNFFRGASADRDWQGFRAEMTASGVTVLDAGDTWWPYLVAADIALCDYTSLSLYFAQLVRPIVFVKIQENDFFPGSPLLQLYEISPRLTEPQRLRSILAQAEHRYPLEKLRHIAEQTVSFREGAANRIRAAVAETVGLPSTTATSPNGCNG